MVNVKTLDSVFENVSKMFSGVVSREPHEIYCKKNVIYIHSDRAKEVGGVCSLVLAHGGTFILGAVDGAAWTKGYSVDVPLRYVCAGNALGTAAGFGLQLTTENGTYKLKDAVKAFGWGAGLAPFEYYFGVVVGTVGGSIANMFIDIIF